MITLTVDTGAAVRKIDTLATSIADLAAPFAAWNKWYRQKVQKKFDEGGPGWPPTKKQASAGAAVNAWNRYYDKAKKEGGKDLGIERIASGGDAVKQLGDALLRRKLQRELKRATKRYARGGSAAAMQRRYAVLQEFERIAAGGVPIATLTADKRLEKSVAGLRARHERAHAKAAGRPLGRIASSIKSKITRTDITVSSEIPWAGVQNKGGTVGHGAKLPARPFLELDDEDIEMLVTLIEEHTRFSL